MENYPYGKAISGTGTPTTPFVHREVWLLQRHRRPRLRESQETLQGPRQSDASRFILAQRNGTRLRI